jgi:Leucine-rich repeat (LRR) protein
VVLSGWKITYSRAWGIQPEQQKYGLYPKMILQIVLVIVTAVPVNSQELCPSVCQCSGDNATCIDLFNDVVNVTQHKLHSGLKRLRVTGKTNLELEEDLFLRWDITSLINLNLSRNSIRKIWQRAFYSLAELRALDLNGNSIITLDHKTFFNNTNLYGLGLARNSITDIHPSTFEKNLRLNNIFMNGNKISSLHQDLFKNNAELEKIVLLENRIAYIHPSTFRNNSRLRYLDISNNKITLISPDTFFDNRELAILNLRGNNISEISNTLFLGLEQLVILDLSSNSIEQLNPLVFHNTINSTHRQNHQASKLKHINLAHNMIQSFNFELYFPINSDSASSIPTFQLDYLNLSSNGLTTLDLASMKWLNHTTAVADLSANPWNCDCSVLLEVWRGLKHKLTLQCASPRPVRGMSWDVMEVCSSKSADDKPDRVYEPSVLTTTLIVFGVLLVGVIGWGLFLAKVAKCRRKRPNTTECSDAYPPRASHVSLHLYEEVGEGPSYVTDETYADVGKRPSYLSVHS